VAILADLLAAFQANRTAIERWRVEGVTLRKYFNLYPNPLSFMNNLRRNFSGLAPFDAGQAWQAAKFFGSVQAALGELPRTAVIPAQFLPLARVHPEDYSEFAPRRFGVTVEMGMGGDDLPPTVTRWIRLPKGGTASDAIAAAVTRLVRMWKDIYEIDVTPDQISKWTANAKVVQIDAVSPEVEGFLVPREVPDR